MTTMERPSDRDAKVIVTALTRYAEDLVKESKRLDDLGEATAGKNLQTKATYVREVVMAPYNEQLELNIRVSDEHQTEILGTAVVVHPTESARATRKANLRLSRGKKQRPGRGKKKD